MEKNACEKLKIQQQLCFPSELKLSERHHRLAINDFGLSLDDFSRRKSLIVDTYLRAGGGPPV